MDQCSKLARHPMSATDDLTNQPGHDLFGGRVPAVGLVRGDGVKVLGVGGGEELLTTPSISGSGLKR
jgi:hypothetical protein